MSAHNRRSNKLGEGTFGKVIARNGRAVKYFKRLDHLIQEVIMTLYMNDSPFTTQLLGYNFENLTMETALWETNLREAMLNFSFDFEEKKKIFRGLLIGLNHMHSRRVIHSDFKPSNVLINTKNDDVCIADMGLTSTTKYAKVRQTAPAYRPDVAIPMISHDMFGMAVSMTEFFGNFKLKKRVDAPRLREHIKRRITDPTIRKVLTMMSPDNPLDSITARDALREVFREVNEIPVPAVKSFDSRIRVDDAKFVQETIRQIMRETGINRDARCYYGFLTYVNNPDNPPVEPIQYPLYIAVMIMIFSATFGRHGFGLREVQISLGNFNYSLRDIYKALYNIIQDKNYINFIMMPDLKSSDDQILDELDRLHL
jgi:hypothetical protein